MSGCSEVTESSSESSRNSGSSGTSPGSVGPFTVSGFNTSLDVCSSMRLRCVSAKSRRAPRTAGFCTSDLSSALCSLCWPERRMVTVGERCFGERSSACSSEDVSATVEDSEAAGVASLVVA